MARTGREDDTLTGTESWPHHELVVELRILAGLRARVAVRDRPLPALWALLDPSVTRDPDPRYASLLDLVDRGIEEMTDPDHQRAAIHLLGSEEGRWQPLKQRGAEAGAVFGLGWDAYRRKRPTTGVSLMFETLGEVALAMLRISGNAVAGGSPTPAATPADPTVDTATAPSASSATSGAGGPTGTRRRWIAVGIALAVAALAVGLGAAAIWPKDHPSTDRQARPEPTPSLCGNLVHRVGDLPPSASAELRAWVAPFKEAAADLPPDRTICAGLIESSGDQILQRISGGGNEGAGMLVAAAAPGSLVVALDARERVEFEAGQLDQPNPTRRLGTPTKRADRPDGVRVVELTSGVMVSEKAESPTMTVSQRNWERWKELGGLDGEAGRPLSSRYDRPGTGSFQEFEGGQLFADYRTSELTWEPLTGADLVLPDGYRGSILVAETTATSWFVDTDGVRHWIPTDSDYMCVVESHGAKEIRDVSSAAIASLPAGEAIRCR